MRVVDAALQHRLVARDDAALEHAVERALGDRGDLVRVVEVRVEHDLLVQLAAALDDRGQRVEPLVSVMSFIGITAGPLVANRMRRMFGISSSRLPISVIWRALSW